MDDSKVTHTIELFKNAMFHAILGIFVGTILLVRDGETSLLVSGNFITMAIYLKKYNDIKKQLSSEEYLFYKLICVEKKERIKCLLILFAMCLLAAFCCYVFHVYFRIRKLFFVVFLSESILFLLLLCVRFVLDKRKR